MKLPIERTHFANRENIVIIAYLKMSDEIYFNIECVSLRTHAECSEVRVDDEFDTCNLIGECNPVKFKWVQDM